MEKIYKYTVIITFANGNQRGFLVELDTYDKGRAIQKVFDHAGSDLMAGVSSVSVALILMGGEDIIMCDHVIG